MSHSRKIMSALSDPNDDPTIIFVVDLHTTSDVSPTSEELADTTRTLNALDEGGLRPRYITEAECLRVTERRGAVYVFSTFRGRAFEYLKARGCRIYGTPIVQQCIDENGRLPKVDYPVFANTLRAAFVCCTGLRTQEKERIKEKVKWMGGRFSADYFEFVTHLIAEECTPNSRKYCKATVSKVPVLQKQWIDDAWDQVASRRCNDPMTSQDVVRKYKTPIFKNLTITVSGLATLREEIKQQIQENGGTFTGEMKRLQCTHLVTDRDSGQKVAKAKQWGTVKIVTPLWVQQSVQAGYRFDEVKYCPSFADRGPMSSTQAVPVSMPLPDPDISAIPGPSGSRIGGIRNFNATNSILTNGSVTASRVAETTTASSISRNVHGGTFLVHRNEPEPEAQRNQHTVLKQDRSNAEPLSSTQRLMAEPMPDPDTSAIPGPSGSRIGGIHNGSVLSAATASRVAETSISRNVHEGTFTVHRSEPEPAPEPEARRIQPTELKQDRIDTEPLSSTQMPMAEPMPDPNISAIPDPNGVRNPNHTSSMLWPLKQDCVEPDPEPQPAVDPPAQPRFIKQEPAETVNLKQDQNEEPANQEVQQNQTVGDASFRVVTIFQGKTFRLGGFSEDEDVDEQIADLGGVVLSTDDARVADYCIYPLLLTDQHDIIGMQQVKALEIASFLWIYQLQADPHYYDPSEDPMFRPIVGVDVPSDLFAGCIVAISSAGFKKAVYVDLIVLLEAHGAVIQRDIRTRDTAAGKRNTHLIIGADNVKVGFAKKHGIPVVDAAWVLECIIQKKQLPAEMFPFDAEAFKNYARTDEAFIRAQRREAILEKVEPAEEQHVEDQPLDEPQQPEQHIHKDPVEADDQHVDVVNSYISPAQPFESFQFQAVEDEHMDVENNFNFLPAAQAQPLDDDSRNNIPAAQPVEEDDSDLDDLRIEVEDESPGNLRVEPSPEVVENTPITPVRHATPPSRIASPQNFATPQNQANPEVVEAATVTPGCSKAPEASDFATPAHQNVPLNEGVQDSGHARMEALDAAMARFEKMAHVKPRVSISNKNYSLQDNTKTNKENTPMQKRTSDSQIGGSSKRIKLTQTPRTQESIRVGWDDGRLAAVSSYPPTQQLQVKELKQQSVKIVGCASAKRIAKIDTPPDALEQENPVPDTEPEMFAETEPEPVVPAQRRIFYFTGMSRDERLNQQCRDIVRNLGGEMDSTDGRGEPTHLITLGLTRSEKILSALARGLWILAPEYLLACQEAGQFIDESAFEHGHCGKVYKTEIEQKIAEACRRWRLKLKNNPDLQNGAYSRWNTAVYGGSKAESVIRLIKQGGGIARNSTELGNSFAKVNRVLTDSPKNISREELIRLVRWNIPVFKIEFAATALLEYPLMEQAHYTVEYRTLLESGMVL